MYAAGDCLWNFKVCFLPLQSLRKEFAWPWTVPKLLSYPTTNSFCLSKGENCEYDGLLRLVNLRLSLTSHWLCACFPVSYKHVRAKFASPSPWSHHGETDSLITIDCNYTLPLPVISWTLSPPIVLVLKRQYSLMISFQKKNTLKIYIKC